MSCLVPQGLNVFYISVTMESWGPYGSREGLQIYQEYPWSGVYFEPAGSPETLEGGDKFFGYREANFH